MVVKLHSYRIFMKYVRILNHTLFWTRFCEAIAFLQIAILRSDKSRKVGQIPKVGQIAICCSVLRAFLSLASIAESCKDCWVLLSLTAGTTCQACAACQLPGNVCWPVGRSPWMRNFSLALRSVLLCTQSWFALSLALCVLSFAIHIAFID